MDPSIYAVSDFTRFSRMYKDAVAHIRYNPRELGAYVALKMLAYHLDPQSSKLKNINSTGSDTPDTRRPGGGGGGRSVSQQNSSIIRTGSHAQHAHYKLLPLPIVS